ncbi:MAG: GNAT family N-acetyltransferase [Marmoricola sp.]
MSEPRTDVEVRDNPDESRYEVVVGADGQQSVAGYAVYERHDGLIAFLHTEVDKAYGGQGIGHVLMQQSLDDVRSKGLTVRPVCPFYKRFFEEHPEYADLV